MAGQLSACPVCRVPQDAARLLWREHRNPTSERAAFHELFIACASCLAIVRNVVEEGGTPAEQEVFAPGGAVTRIRERLAGAREEGRLDAEVVAIVESEEMPLLGVPEAFRDARAAIGGGFVRLTHDAATFQPYFPHLAMPLPATRWPLEKFGAHFTKEELAQVEPEGLGGFVFVRANVRVLRATRFAVVGVSNRSFALAAPSAVVRRWGSHPGFLAAATIALPDRVGRP